MDNLPFQLPVISGTELFPTAIQTPAHTRVHIGLDGQLPDGVNPGQVQAEGEAIIVQYSNHICHFLQGQRQHAHAGGLPVWAKSLDLPQMSMTYSRLHGAESFVIRALVKLGQLPKPETTDLTSDQLCLLVLYEGHKVAAIPMTALRSGSVYSSPLAKSSWRVDGQIPSTTVCQLKLSKTFEPIVASFKIVGRSITPLPTDGSSGGGWCWNASNLFAAGADCDSPGIMNGSGNTLYTNWFTLTNVGGKVTAAHGAGFGSNAGLYAIGQSGQMYYGVASGGAACPTYVVGFDHTLTGPYDAAFTADVAGWAAGPAPGLGSALITPGYSFSEPYLAGTESASSADMRRVGEYAVAQIVQSGLGTPAWGWSVPRVTYTKVTTSSTIDGSIDIYLPMYSGGTVGIRSYTSTFSLTKTYIDTRQYIDDPANPSSPLTRWQTALEYRRSASCGGFNLTDVLSLNYTYDSGVTGVDSSTYPTIDIFNSSLSSASIPSVTLNSWPFGYNGITFATYQDASPATTGYIQTPYGRLGGPNMISWLHVSNDKHAIQGIIEFNSDYSVSTPHLWLDGKEYGGALAGALGTTLDQIDAVLMDIKLADIKKLV
jgi:hypothetical protein